MGLKIIKTVSTGFSVVKKNPILIVPPLIGNLIFILPQLMQIYPTTGVSVLIAILANIVGIFTYAITICAGYDAVRRKKISLGKSFETVLNKFVPVILATLLMVTLTIGGFVLLVIPGVFLLVKLFFYEFAILIDNAGVKDSLKKSWRITKGSWWNIFALLLLMGVTYISLAVFDVTVSFLLPMASVVLSPVLFSLITAWYTVSLVVAYMQLRRK